MSLLLVVSLNAIGLTSALSNLNTGIYFEGVEANSISANAATVLQAVRYWRNARRDSTAPAT